MIPPTSSASMYSLPVLELRVPDLTTVRHLPGFLRPPFNRHKTRVVCDSFVRRHQLVKFLSQKPDQGEFRYIGSRFTRPAIVITRRTNRISSLSNSARSSTPTPGMPARSEFNPSAHSNNDIDARGGALRVALKIDDLLCFRMAAFSNHFLDGLYGWKCHASRAASHLVFSSF